MVEPNPGAILREWQDALSQLTRAVPTGPIDAELVGRLVTPLKAQVDAIQRALDQQRERQEQVVGRMFEPLDQVLGALDDTVTAMRGQAAALRQAGESLSRVAELLEVQAAVVEGATSTVRVPTDLVRGPLQGESRNRARDKGRSPASRRRAPSKRK